MSSNGTPISDRSHLKKRFDLLNVGCDGLQNRYAIDWEGYAAERLRLLDVQDEES
ncbi:hypothetical protein NDI44_22675 [Trichocoleus sp. DQ-A3]|uniref:hypothetical protein n=1 Tax=Cyanophyceae TaxID=3028117 RepID=UPI001687542F|nr:hypothetical protein [Coleofasciculus sp. FACHB-125]MBD1903842.1 hypothetical protein [Coleofasciculus sp. FACHB-125]